MEFNRDNAILNRLIRRFDEFDFGVPSLELLTRLQVTFGSKANGGERNLVIILGMHYERLAVSRQTVSRRRWW